MVVIFMVTYLTKELGYAPTDAGNLLALYGLGTMLGIYLGGRFSDRIGYRPIILIGLFGTSFALLGLGQARTIFELGIGLAILGVIGEVLRPAVSVAIAAHSRPENRSRAFGLLRLCVNLGMTIGPVAGGLLISLDYAWLFYVDAATCLAAGVLFYRLFPKSAVITQDPKEQAREKVSAYRDRPFLIALLLTFIHGLIFFQVMSTLPLYLVEHRGYTEFQFSALFAVNTIVIVLFEMVLLKSIEGRSPLKVVAVAGFLIGIGFGLTSLSFSVAALIGTVLIWTLGEMLAAPVLQTWVSNRADRGNQGQYMAAFAMVFSVASIVAPWIGLRVYQHIGPDWVWHGCLVLGAVQLIGFWRLAKRQ